MSFVPNAVATLRFVSGAICLTTAGDSLYRWYQTGDKANKIALLAFATFCYFDLFPLSRLLGACAIGLYYTTNKADAGLYTMYHDHVVSKVSRNWFYGGMALAGLITVFARYESTEALFADMRRHTWI